MWWTYQAGSSFTAKYPMLGKQTFYRGLGTGEQGLWVIPGAELVVVHRADTDHGRTVESTDQWRLVESILAARQTEPAADADLGPLQAIPLASQLPAVAIPEDRALPASVITGYLGDYKLAAGATRLGQYRVTEGGAVRVFLFDEKPYTHLPGLSDV